MNVDFELYKYFSAVAKNKNMTKASEDLHISQPALSQSIKKLEDQIGCTLFIRNNKGMELTKEGQTLYDYVESAISLLKNAENELTSFKDLDKGEIRIGASTTITRTYLIDSIKKFHKLYPNIKINIYNDLTNNLLLDLQKGKLDYVIYNDDVNNIKDINTKVLYKIKQGFIYNPEFFKDNITSFAELNNYPLILQKEESNSRKLLDSISLKNNIKLVPRMEVVSQELVTEFTNIGLGVGFSIIDLANRNYHNLKELNINKLIPNINVYLATNKSVSPTFASKTFINYLKGMK
jgi:DNA-binding transcriptional LysR family regulator